METQDLFAPLAAPPAKPAPACDRVRQFGFAMAALGLRISGLDAREFDVDLGCELFVAARLIDKDQRVSARWHRGSQVQDEWSGDYGAEATRKVEEFIEAAMAAPARAAEPAAAARA